MLTERGEGAGLIPAAEPAPIEMASAAPAAGGRFRGPLGLWPWPLVNLILALAERLAARPPAPAPAEPPPKRRRMSVWSIERDADGRIANILEREVEEL